MLCKVDPHTEQGGQRGWYGGKDQVKVGNKHLKSSLPLLKDTNHGQEDDCSKENKHVNKINCLFSKWLLLLFLMPNGPEILAP